MKNGIVFFCIMLNLIAYGMDDEACFDLNLREKDYLDQVPEFEDKMRKCFEEVVRPMHEKILGDNFETLIASNDATAIEQIWNQEKGGIVDTLTKAVEKMNSDDPGPGYLKLAPEGRMVIKGIQQKAIDQYGGGLGKKDLVRNMKFVQNIYAIHKAKQAQASSAST